MRGRLRSLLALLVLINPVCLRGTAPTVALLQLSLLAVAGIVATALVDRYPIESRGDSRFLGKTLTPVFLAFTCLAIVARLPAVVLPLLPFSEASRAVGLPAEWWGRLIGSLGLYNRLAVCLSGWLVFIVFLQQRRTVSQLLGEFGTFVLFMGWIVGLGVILAWHFPGFPGHATLERLLPPDLIQVWQASPPLGRLLTTSGYLLFGIDEMVPYGLQITFTIATAAILASWGHMLNPGSGIISAGAWLFLPVFVSPVLLGGEQCGEIFFLTATLHFALRLITRPRAEDQELYYTSCFAGLLFTDAVWLALPLVAVFVLLAPLPREARRHRGAALLLPPFAFALPWLLLVRRSAWLDGFSLAALRAPDTLIPTVAPILWSMGPALALAGMLGLMRLLARPSASFAVRATALWFLLGLAALWASRRWSLLAPTTLLLPPLVLGLTAWAGTHSVPRTTIMLALAAALTGLLPLGSPSSELVTLGNYQMRYLPVEQALQTLPEWARVYAPLRGLPGPFYLAKNGRQPLIDYRTAPASAGPVTWSEALAGADRLAAGWLIVPRPGPAPVSPHARLTHDQPVWREQNPGWSGESWRRECLAPEFRAGLKAPPVPWRLHGEFSFGASSLLLLARQPENPDNSPRAEP